MSESFPLRDPVGRADSAPLVPNADVIADVVAPGAADVDALGVRRATIDALAGAGLLGSPLVPVVAQRELAELLAGADASTWFCWVQHYSPLRELEAASGDSPLLPALRSGSALAAVAFAHVRRPGPANPVATRMPGGAWRLDGTLDWVTSWDIADVVMVMAQGDGPDSDKLVCCFLPAGHSGEAVPGVEVGPAMRLLAMSGTHTRQVRLSGVVVPDAQVGAVHDRRQWLEADATTSANANPAAFGVARGALAELSLIAEQRSDGLLAELASSLVVECRTVRAQAYEASDDPGAGVDERLAIRARALDLCLRATTAVVIARAGAAMRSGGSAERRVREALFLQVQAQTAASRRASVELLLRRR